MIMMDANGKSQTVEVTGWYDGQKFHNGHYGSWTMVNENPMTREEVIGEEDAYQGDGSAPEWRISWDD